jgi:UDPglucose--hexose-1-phosphate uridylyltransferase
VPGSYEFPHRRFNPLTREWVLVSPHRTKRPWQGQIEKTDPEVKPAYDPKCYLCPGNERAGGVRNPTYESTFAFDNDFAALLPDAPPFPAHDSPLLVAEAERGVCRVVCFSPRHDLALGDMAAADIRKVVDAWVSQYQELGAMPFIHYVQIFENRGAMMGASNPHPHCQIWATEHLPNEPQKEQNAFTAAPTCLLCDYVQLELTLAERTLYENDSFLVVVPYWALWPFETLVISRRHLTAMDELSETERDDLAETLRRAAGAYDRVFDVMFPYSMGFHQRPTDGDSHPEWHFHAHFYPPLLRSATVKKFMVGFEMLGSPQRDLTAEQAAQRLRELF